MENIKEEDIEEVGKKSLRVVIGLTSIIMVFLLLSFYLFIPFSSSNFIQVSSRNSNFSSGINNSENFQFYENMRFPSPSISYRIEDCPLQKKNDMELAFEIMVNETILEFYNVVENEEIIITCQSQNKVEGDFFIAGEGGPTEIIRTENFNVIRKGKILLLKDSDCPIPNVAIHELLHVLGFKHSSNPLNIMYNVTSCRETIGDDIPLIINNVYSYPNLVDLSLENVSALMNGKYLDINFTIKNNGLKDSNEFDVYLYADGEEVRSFEIKPLEIGYGKSIQLGNVWVSQLSVDEIKVVAVSDSEEFSKSNNEVLLKIKNKK